MTVTPQTNATLEDIADVLRANDSFVICGHVSPDGDCLGSQLALYHALKSIGKRATCLLVRDEPVPRSFSFMPGIADMVAAEHYDGAADVFVGVDVPTRERVGEPACRVLDACADSVTIDHHATPERMCRLAYVDPDSASASMLVWKLAKLICDGLPPKDSAVCSYVGLMTDTGGFRYQNSDHEAFITAAELVGAGVDPSLPATNIYQSKSLASVKLESLTIERMILGEGGAFALSWITEQDKKAVGAQKGDVDTLVDALRSVDGVRVACMLREQGGIVRVNLRAKDETDVSALAFELGGGGHRAAAGITLAMPIDEAIPLMLERVAQLVAKTPVSS